MSRTNLPRARSSARPVLSLLSVLAVLAMACFPGLAAADNSGIQYEVDEQVPNVPSGNNSGNIPSKDSGDSNSNPGATGSNTPGGVGSGGDDDSSTGGAGGNQPNQGSGGGNDRGANGSKPAGGNVGDAQELSTAPSSTNQASDDGGSSPLVPILIAVAVLAAISIGAYYYRQRRQGPGSTVTPPAS